MSLQSPANIAGTFNQTSYNGGSSSGSIIYHSTHVDGSAPASGRYYYRVFVTYDPGTEDNWIYFNTSDNKWYDHDQVLHDPLHFTVNGSSPAGPSAAISGGETVALIDQNGGTIFTFTHPTWLVGSSGGGGGGGQPLSNTGQIVWSYNRSTGKVSAKSVFQDNGAAGFPPLMTNVDVVLVRVGTSAYSDAMLDPNNGFALYDGTEKTLSLYASPGDTWGVLNATTLDQFGDSYKVPSGRVSSNFW